MSQLRATNLFAWQGWQIRLPNKWSPVKLEGTYDEGHALFADLKHPRLGIRWMKAGKKFDAEKWAKKVLRDEVGQLAADESQAFPLNGFDASRLYIEPKPPGRDVWVGFSKTSGRGILLTYHVQRREYVLRNSLLPELVDQSPDGEMVWSVFDLNFKLPPGWNLLERRLNAGDLSLSFSKSRERLTIRRIAMAELALKRLPIDRWILEQQRLDRKHCKPAGQVSDVEMDIGGETIAGRSGSLLRRRRYFFMRSIPREQKTVVLHDREENLLIVGQGSDEKVLRDVISTIGHSALTGLVA